MENNKVNKINKENKETKENKENKGMKINKSKSSKKCFGLSILLKLSIFLCLLFIAFLSYNLTELFEEDIQKRKINKIKEKLPQFTNFTEGQMNLAFGIFYQNNTIYNVNTSNYLETSELYSVKILNLNKTHKLKKKLNMKICNETDFIIYDNTKLINRNNIINLLCITDSNELITYYNEDEESYIEFNLYEDLNNSNNNSSNYNNTKLKLITFYNEFSAEKLNRNKDKLMLITSSYDFYIDNTSYSKQTLEFSNINITQNENMFIYKRNNNYIKLINSNFEKVLTSHNSLTKQKQSSQRRLGKIILKSSNIRHELDLSYNLYTILIKTIFFFTLICTPIFLFTFKQI